MGRKVKTHRFNGVKYKIEASGEIDGITYTGKDDKAYPLIVACNPKTKKGLITTIHEAMHATSWHSREEVIDRASTEIGTLLWRLGWRRK